MAASKRSSSRTKSEAGREKMPDLRKSDPGRVIGIFCSDIHLSLKAPVARSAEPNWLEAQLRTIKQLKALSAEYDCPLVCCGDIFDKWNSSAELINWAIEHLPLMYAIPGNHDLPLHSYEDRRKSAYWTLVRAKKVINLHPGHGIVPTGTDRMELVGFPWGTKFQKWKPSGARYLVAVVHAYCFGPKGSSYAGVDQSCDAKHLSRQLDGFDFVFVGDNHIPFFWYPDETLIHQQPVVCNNGGLQRRTIAEINHKPRVSLLYESGWAQWHLLDCSEDKFIDVSAAGEIIEKAMDMTEFLDELKKLGEQGLDFMSAVKRFIRDNNIQSGVVRKIMEALEQ